MILRLRQQVYLDNNATTALAPGVVRVMGKVLRGCYGNPSSSYRHARDAAEILQVSRQAVAVAVGTVPERMVFTGSASEANNQILLSCAQAGLACGRRVIVSTPLEHPSVMETLVHLQGMGITVLFCPVDSQGRVVLEALESLVNEQTMLVCCMLANNETGVVQEVGQIAALAHRHGALMMSDCVQALGKWPVDVLALGVDFATFSAHKIHGPKGVGALYAKEGAPLFPLIHGGLQESGLRAGTEGVHNIAGFGEACRNVPNLLAASGRIATLRDRLAAGIREIFPEARFNSPVEGCLPNTLSVTFPGCDGSEAIGFLDYHGIGVSAGSACNTQANAPSHVLKAIGLSDEEARQTLRFSLSDQTRGRQIVYVLAVLRDFLERRALPVTMIRPAQVDENLLFSESVFILDVRHGYDRKLLKGLPNAHETSISILKGNLDLLPRDKSILVVCQGGMDGAGVAYFLRSKGFKNVSFVMGGVLGWKLFQPALYARYGDKNKKTWVMKP